MWFRKGRKVSEPASLCLLAVITTALLLTPGSSALAFENQKHKEKPNFQFQLRLGPYYPDVDTEDAISGEPFATTFGSSSEVLFELGLDYEVWNGYGAVTIGGSFGFVQYLGKARMQNADGTVSTSASSDTTVFNLFPMRLTFGSHFDPMVDWGIPLVLYVHGGLSYYIWWILDGVGNISSWTDADGNSHKARGGIFGVHAGAGIKLLLDYLDPEAAVNLHNETGIMNTYLFAEYIASWVDDFNSGVRMDVGDQTFMFGLMMEF